MNQSVKLCTGLLLSALVYSSKSIATENLVFVHGAHFDARSWRPVSSYLSSDVNVLAVNLPGRNTSEDASKIGLSNSAKSLCENIRSLEGNIHFAAHSQGGAVVHSAIGICPSQSIKSITYITSVAPLVGESAFASLNADDEKHYFKGVSYNENNHRMEIRDWTHFNATFAQDASSSQTKQLRKLAIDEPAHIGEEAVKYGKAELDRISKHYVFANQDKIISLESQLKIANSLNVHSVYSLQTGHLPMLTNAKELAMILDGIVENVASD
ncbi:hypothetical protein TUMSATVNIG1_20570 [Vibrio nigripulchritudo]|uniref:alpha/beta hydrolase n=1 Tax=Vibrio nigripulchritudo TaxID=28173 RepID=UPI0019095231|nr:alpha/beta hydrolase [Vibrio nigripulchritudo]BCL70098.1 hypothetical protein VNTUMSATTG_20350 [Vibrio nigripulchritudo]BDU31448.1 hypothetical protein TUMSATVNIG1_20570 [Vibrio nigripulchritudo]